MDRAPEPSKSLTLNPWPLSANKSFECQRGPGQDWKPCGRMDVVRATGWWAIRECYAGNIVSSENGVKYRRRT